MGQEYQVERDATLGLIFRLNHLWAVTDDCAMEADYDGWNNTLDCLWRNLLYRNSLVIIKDDNKITIKLSEDDDEVWKVLCDNVIKAKINWMKAKIYRPKVVRSFWGKRYAMLQMKDLFVRKLMFKLKLYLKETKTSPGTTMFGG